jgi:hypothetical protein
MGPAARIARARLWVGMALISRNVALPAVPKPPVVAKLEIALHLRASPVAGDSTLGVKLSRRRASASRVRGG